MNRTVVHLILILIDQKPLRFSELKSKTSVNYFKIRVNRFMLKKFLIYSKRFKRLYCLNLEFHFCVMVKKKDNVENISELVTVEAIFCSVSIPWNIFASLMGFMFAELRLSLKLIYGALSLKLVWIFCTLLWCCFDLELSTIWLIEL